ncbi:hypothetical protein U1Q18_018906 [Sarracenia purpurea var. burkii]
MKRVEQGGRASGAISLRLRQLPLLQARAAKMTRKEAVRMSILSKRWRFIWTCHANLWFDSANVLGTIAYSNNISNCRSKLERQVQRCEFIKRVDQFMHERGKGSKVDSFFVHFPLSKDFAQQLNQWVSCAIIKGVENIDLDLSESYGLMVDHDSSSTSSEEYDFPLLASCCCWQKTYCEASATGLV